MRHDNLLLYSRQNEGTAFRANLTDVAQDWQRSIAAIGGYKLGTFRLTEEQVTRAELEDYYTTWIGCVLTEQTAGIESWSGIISELRLVKGGVEYLTTLDPEWFQNKVKVLYTDSNGQQQEIAWLENTDASDIYGEMQYILAFGGGAATPMAYAQATHLAQFAWPRSRMVGVPAVGGEAQPGPDRLEVLVAGWWSTLNWRYYETSLSAAADVLMGTLQAASEWVLDGRREENTMTIYLDCDPPQRLGDLMRDIIEQGDSSGNMWKGGVYAGRKLIYEQAPQTVDYYLRGGVLVDKAGGEVIPSLLEAGFLLENADAPSGTQPPGTSSAWDNPKVGYVEEVEYRAPDGLRLKLYGQEERLAVLSAQMRGLQNV